MLAHFTCAAVGPATYRPILKMVSIREVEMSYNNPEKSVGIHTTL